VSVIADMILKRIPRRPPDFVIGSLERPYLRRWFVIPRNRFFNVYLHQFLRSDDDRALHDHPWANLSVLLRGSYVEHTIEQGGVERHTKLVAGDWRFRWTGRIAHRIEIDAACWTLFITGPRYRSWGFHCPQQGWIHWERFTKVGAPGEIGPGCDA
jgi:hypothetical protein